MKLKNKPVAAGEAAGEVHVFAGRAGGVFHRRVGGSAEWESLGEQSFAAGFAAQATQDRRTLVLFGFDADRTVHCKTWNGRTWTPSQTSWKRLPTIDELDQPLLSLTSKTKPRSKPARSKRVSS